MHGRSRRFADCLIMAVALAGFSLIVPGSPGSSAVALAVTAGRPVSSPAWRVPVVTRTTGASAGHESDTGQGTSARDGTSTRRGPSLSPGPAPKGPHRTPAKAIKLEQATGSAPCFGDTFPDCASTDPDVSFSLYSDGDTTGCTFEGDVDWGDGTEDVVDFSGVPDGDVAVTFTHTYDDWGVYPIQWSSNLVSGSTCVSSSGTLQFTLGTVPTSAQQGGAPNPSQDPTTCSSEEPVNCATGAFWQQFVDFSVPGRGVPLDLTRTYSSSQADVAGPFGYGWAFSYGMSLSTDASGDVTVTQEDGSTVTFTPGSSGGYTAPPDVLASLTENSDGSYTFVRYRSQVRYNFSASGELTSESDPNGYVTDLSYNGAGQLTSVTDPAGRQLTFTYSGSHVATVTDPLGRIWTYGYDSNGNLVSATDPAGNAWSFGYDSGHLLLTVTDPRGGVTTNTYNGSDQVVSQEDPDGNTTTWSYSGDPSSDSGGTTTMTDPDGNVTVYDYADFELISVTAAVGTAAAATTSYAYDPLTNGVASVTDPNGNVTTDTYDSDGNLLSTTDPLGNTTSYTYNSLNELLTKTSPLGEVTSYDYDAEGNLLSVTDPLGNVTTYAYGDSHPGDITAVTDPDGNVTSYTYDEYGDVASVSVSPSSGVTDTTAYAYDADGERTCMASPNATQAQISCPSAGSPAVAGTTATTYDADGEITSVTNPDGQTTTYAYDGDGNEVKATDPAGQVTTYQYNGDNEQIKETRPDGTSTTRSYDGDGNLITQVNAVGATTSYTYDGLNQVATVTDPLGNVTSYGYDADGNRTSITYPSGQVTLYEYDGDNELTAIDYSDGVTPDVSIAYDADGQRSEMTDGTGTTDYTYDADGHLISVTNGAGATVGYGYDPAGLLTTLTYPNGQNVTRTYDGAGQLTAVSDWLGNTTKFSYDADGNLTTEAYPNGVTATSTFDAADQLLSITDSTAASTLASFTYTRNNLGLLASAAQSGALSGTANYSYTQLSQLSSDGSGGSYSYDAAGDLTGLPSGATMAYNADGELTSATQTATAVPPATDDIVSANETAKTAKITSPPVTTKAPGELLLAFISANGPTSKHQKVTSVTGAGLTWALVVRSNAEHGTAEVWQAYASAVVASAKITATLADKGYDGSITVATFTGASAKAGAYVAAHAATGAPATSLTTTGPDSLVWAVGEDSEHAIARTAGEGQTVVHQYLDTKGSSTAWVQQTGALASAGSVVAINDTAPVKDRWELAAVEITTATPGGTQTTTYSYDTQGNRTGVSVAGQPGTTLTYDQAGELTGYGSVATYSYDGDGLRMSKTVGGNTTSFAWDQSGTVPLLISAGSTSYIYGPAGQPIEQIAGGTATYLLDDAQGSTRLLTSSSGAVVGTYSYSSYGAVISHTGTVTTALQYQGQYTDAESGYIYLQARYYDPATGQFISADPLVSLTLSAYGYAADNPVNDADPLGLAWYQPSTWWSQQTNEELQTAGKWIGIIGLGAGLTALTIASGGLDVLLLGALGSAEAVTSLEAGVAAVSAFTEGAGFGLNAATTLWTCDGGSQLACGMSILGLGVNVFGVGQEVSENQLGSFLTDWFEQGYDGLKEDLTKQPEPGCN